MAKQEIDIGTSPNDGTGDTLRDSFEKINSNFDEIYDAIGGAGNVGTLAPALTVTANLTSTGNSSINTSNLTLFDATDTTKKITFSAASISSGQTRTITIPDSNTTLVGSNIAQTITNKTIDGSYNTLSNIDLASTVTGTLAKANGGTGGLLTYAYGGTGVSTAPTDGQILIGNGSGYQLGTITAGAGIAITNTPGGIQIDNTGGGGGGGGSGYSISANNCSVLVAAGASNVGGTVTTTIDGAQAILSNANVTIFSTSLQTRAGTTSRAPLVIPAGTITTTPVSGAIEYDSTKFYITIAGVRKQVATYDQITSGAVTAFNTRTGNVTLNSTDVLTALGYTPLSANTGGNIAGNITVFNSITTAFSNGVTGGTINTGTINAVGNITANNITANTGITGTLQTASQTNITSVGTLTSLTVTGNVTSSGNLVTSGTVINSGITTTGNVTGVNFIGNLVGLVTGNTTGTHTGNVTGNLTGTVLTASQTNITSVGTLGSLAVTGNITAGNVISTFYGSLTGNTAGTHTGNVTGNLTGAVLTASQTAITSVGTLANLTVAGVFTINANGYSTAIVNSGTNGSGNIGASGAGFNTVFAKATSAQYADLAEKYLADQDYAIGTVVVIGGTAEVTASSAGQRAIGAVSAKPAYMMNSDLEGGTYIALKGRVPVLVTGSVTKGDRLVAGPLGTAVKATMAYYADTFAVALESSDDENIKTIEAIIL